MITPEAREAAIRRLVALATGPGAAPKVPAEIEAIDIGAMLAFDLLDNLARVASAHEKIAASLEKLNDTLDLFYGLGVEALSPRR